MSRLFTGRVCECEREGGGCSSAHTKENADKLAVTCQHRKARAYRPFPPTLVHTHPRPQSWQQLTWRRAMRHSHLQQAAAESESVAVVEEAARPASPLLLSTGMCQLWRWGGGRSNKCGRERGVEKCGAGVSSCQKTKGSVIHSNTVLMRKAHII